MASDDGGMTDAAVHHIPPETSILAGALTAVLIKGEATDRLVRELASRTGETITEAVRRAAEERLSRLEPRRGRVDRAKLAQALAYVAALPRTNAHLIDDETIGHDDDGHFD